MLADLPSPARGVWYLGPFPIRGYALCIVLGVLVAVWVSERRWVARGGRPGTVGDVAVWAVPFGLVGGRLYHVLTDPQLYFGEGRNPVTALYIWRGGLGIWGAITLGALGAYIGCRRHRARFGAFADAAAPGIVLAQAVGRLGNWFNQELYGKPTSLPWGLQIDPEHRRSLPADLQRFETFHPTFLYECLWNIGVAGLVVWADRRFRLGHGRAFAVYVMAYTAGRGWIEYLRIDTANTIAGVRLNIWTSVVVFLLAAAYFVVMGRRHPERETEVQPSPDDEDGREDEDPDTDSASTDAEAEEAGASDAEAKRDPPDARRAASVPEDSGPSERG